MNEQQALLEAIRERPDDDTPRLAYADWLDEHGAPGRAEFIRIQIEIAAARREVSAISPVMSDRELELFTSVGTRWPHPLTESPRLCDFKRGFIERVWTTAQDAPRILNRLRNSSPLHTVSFLYAWSEAESHLEPTQEGEATSTIPILTERGIARAGMETLAGIGALSIICTNIDTPDVAVEKIATDPDSVCDRLLFSFMHCMLGNTGARWLAESPVFEHLEGIRIVDDGVNFSRSLRDALHRRYGERYVVYSL